MKFFIAKSSKVSPSPQYLEVEGVVPSYLHSKFHSACYAKVRAFSCLISVQPNITLECHLSHSGIIIFTISINWIQFPNVKTSTSKANSRTFSVDRSRTGAQSVKSQSRKVVIWELICLFTLVRSPCLFCLCMRLMRIKIFTCASMRMDPHMRIIRMNRMDPQPHGQA